MASAPLNWLLKIGGTTLKTTAQTLTGAVNELKDLTSSLQSQTGSQFSAVAADMSKKVNKTDVLNLEEIEATTDLTDKVAAAEAVKEVNDSLQADNGQQFQFAYDTDSGKYGYMAEMEGADTFVPFSVEGYIDVEESRFKSSYQSLIRVGTDISHTPSGKGFGCSIVRLNMDKIKSIKINTIQVCNTYASTYTVALLDTPATSYDNVYNNQKGAYSLGSSSSNWTALNTNISIDCTNLKGFKYLATAYTTNHASYQSGMAQITSMTITFKE